MTKIWIDRPYTDLRELYRTKVLQNLENLSENRKQHFSSEFQSYFNYYDSVSNENICKTFYASDSSI